MKLKGLMLLALSAVLLAVAGGVTAQDSVEGTALAFVAETYDVPAADLVVDYKLVIDVPAMGTVTQYKMRNPSSQAVYGSFVDSAGHAWTPEDFRAAADAAYQAQYGKLDSQLFRRYEENPNARIPVEIWLVVDDSLLAGLRGPDYVGPGLGLNAEPQTQGDLMHDGAAPSAHRENVESASVLAAQEALAAQVVSLQTNVASRLAAQGIDVRFVPQAPVLGATLNRDQALAAADEPEVGRIYADDIESQDLNGSAQNTQRAPAVWGRGYTGSGASVAILEDSRAYQNFWLYNYASARDWGSPNMDDHATRTMGNVNSSHGFHLGIARGAAMYSANATDYSTANIQAAANWAVAQGVDVINNSWGAALPSGCLSSLGRFFDYRVVVDRVLVTHAAGNSADLINDHAMAFNILTVGSFDDHNDANWSNDDMSSFSAWREGTGCSPSNGDRQEPDLVAVGERIRSTRIHPPSIDFQDWNSTSYSAPMVAGEAALMLDVDSNLAGKPEAMRATLMASAANNVEGNARLSEYDGAGGIDVYSAYLDVLNGRYAQMTINPTTWTSYDFTFYADTDEPISCVAAWTSHPNASYTSDPLLTDLDLRLYKPSGPLAQSSTSSNNSYEIVRTTTDEAGTWTCRVSKYSTSGSTWEYLGIAVDRAFQYDYDYPYVENAVFLPTALRAE
ncbi:MAG: S8 family serine peptidase [Anaerolineae bacterium]